MYNRTVIILDSNNPQLLLKLVIYKCYSKLVKNFENVKISFKLTIHYFYYYYFYYFFILLLFLVLFYIFLLLFIVVVIIIIIIIIIVVI